MLDENIFTGPYIRYACLGSSMYESLGTFTRDRICSDPFGIGSTLFTRDPFETAMVRFRMGSPS